MGQIKNIKLHIVTDIKVILERHTMSLYMFPLELRVHIFRMIDRSDLINLRACNKQLYLEVTPLVWENLLVDVNKPGVGSIADRMENAKFTRSINIQNYSSGTKNNGGFGSFSFGSFIHNCKVKILKSVRFEWLTIGNELAVLADAVPLLQTLNLFCSKLPP